MPAPDPAHAEPAAPAAYADWRTDETPASLWDRVVAEEGGAWETLVEVWTPCVHDYCRRKGLDRTAAEDVAQEVMSRVYKYRSTFSREPTGDRPNPRLRHWLKQVIRHAIADYFERRAVRPAAAGGSAALAALAAHPDAAAPDPAAGLSDDPDRQNWDSDDEPLFDPSIWLAGILEDLRRKSPETHAIYVSARLDREPLVEIASRVGKTANAVRQAVHRLDKRIEREGAELFPDLAAARPAPV